MWLILEDHKIIPDVFTGVIKTFIARSREDKTNQRIK